MKISYRQVEGYCNEMHDLAQKMNELMGKITSAADSVVSGGNWDGEAASFYVDRIKSVTKNFDEVFREMENSVLFMAKCSEGYDSIDKVVVKEICQNLHISSPSIVNSIVYY